jgi:hypothetical protein
MIEWTMLRLASRKTGSPIPQIKNISQEHARAMMGVVRIPPQDAETILEEVFLAWSWVEYGGSLEVAYCADLEERSKSNHAIWPIAARVHVHQSLEREKDARSLLSIQQLPFSLPNVLNETQVEVLASGDRVLNALHVDWVRKLAGHVLDVLVLDCRYVGLWFEPILDILPESSLRRALRKIPRSRKRQEGSLGLAAYYAWRLNMRTDSFLKKGTHRDLEFFELACSVSK